jgi:predicted metal-dependent phosphoesterase TrpH
VDGDGLTGMLKIDLHTHTSRYSSCSRLSPGALCEIAMRRGLDALAITEHHHQWSAGEIAALQARYPALKLYAGVEISCTDGHDYVVLGLDGGPYVPHPMPYRRLRSLLARHPGAFVFVAHPFRYSTAEDGLAGREIDGIEVGNYNVLARPQPERGPAVIEHLALCRKWQRKMGWIALYNSDGHNADMVGTFYNRIAAPDGIPPDEAALIRLLRQGQVHPFQDDDLIRRAINGA